jgi:hypothetical protein
MIPRMKGLRRWIVLASIVGLLGMALWLWLREQQDPVALRLRFQGAQIGATSNRTYKKRTTDSVPVVRFQQVQANGNTRDLETDGADVTTPSITADAPEPKRVFQFQLRDEKVTYTSNASPQPKALRFKRPFDLLGAGYPVVELDGWFELEDHVVFFVTTRGTFSTRTPDVWVVAIGDLLKNQTND